MENFLVAIFGYVIAFVFLGFIIFLLRISFEGLLFLLFPKKEHKKINNQKDERLDLFVERVAKEIFTASSFLIEEFKKHIFLNKNYSINEISEKENDEILFVVTYLLLFHTQRFFFENLIEDEGRAKQFEISLFSFFENLLGGDSRHLTLEVARYVKEGGGDGSREIQYIGNKVCIILQKRDPLLALGISTAFSEFLINIFYLRMKNLWIEYLEKDKKINSSFNLKNEERG